MRLDKLQLLVAQLGEFALATLHVLIVRRDLDSFEISLIIKFVADLFGTLAKLFQYKIQREYKELIEIRILVKSKPRSIKELGLEPLNRVFPSPKDWRDLFIYHLLIDRFNCEEANIPPYSPSMNSTWLDESNGDKWQGGTLKGITKKIDYLKDLGCGCIWLNPVFKNRKEKDTYHGYAVQNFLDVDPRFGTLEDLQELVAESHENDIYIILEIILNFTGNNWAYPDDYPYYYNENKEFPFGFWRVSDPLIGVQWPDDAVWPAELQNPDWYKRKGQIRDWNCPLEIQEGDFFSMKRLDTSHLEVLKAMTEIYKHWIAIADIDGYLVDAAKHTNEESLVYFTSSIKNYARGIGKERFFICGEVEGDTETIERYIDSKSISRGKRECATLDSVLDYPLAEVLEWVLKGYRHPYELMRRYEQFGEISEGYGKAKRFFLTYLDNHDLRNRNTRGRFLYNNPYYRQIIIAIGYLLTSTGIPCIYYGSEQGFNGGGRDERYIRECMFGGRWGAFGTTGHHFFDKNNIIYKEVSRIARVRSREPTLRYGKQYFREISANGKDFGYPIDGRCTLAYSRILEDIEVVIAINLDSNPRVDFITVDSNITPAGRGLVDLLRPWNRCISEKIAERNAIRAPLSGHEISIFK